MNKEKFNKKKLLIFGLPILCLVLVSAALLTYYGQIQQNVNVEQAVVLSGPNCDVDNTCVQELGSIWLEDEDTITSEVYTLTNRDIIPREVSLSTTPNNDEIRTTYQTLEDVEYVYSKTWTENGDVLVTVVDTDGWLEWTYVTTDTPTTKLKMTVEIDNPTGFGITTFDDGSHDGWYYYDSNEIVRISDYDTTNKISGYEFVEINLVTDGLQVRIKKSELPNTFMWQGFANFHSASNWIELNTGNDPWLPTASATIRDFQVSGSQITVPAVDFVDFIVVTEFDEAGTYTITTSVVPVA